MGLGAAGGHKKLVKYLKLVVQMSLHFVTLIATILVALLEIIQGVACRFPRDEWPTQPPPQGSVSWRQAPGRNRLRQSTPFPTFTSASRDRSRKITSTRGMTAAEPVAGV